jgi:hypothetical protein
MELTITDKLGGKETVLFAINDNGTIVLHSDNDYLSSARNKMLEGLKIIEKWLNE